MEKLFTKKTLLLLMLGLFFSIGAKAQTSVPVEGISLPETVTMSLGADTTLIAVITPDDATNKAVVWKIDPLVSDVIEIDTSDVDKTRCIVSAIGVGEDIELTVKALDGNFTAKCKITVIKPVEGMELDGNKDIEIIIGKDSLLKVKVDPFDATNPAVIWESRDSTIVDLISTEENRTDSICEILPLRPGTTRIYAKTDDGDFEDFYEITVKSAEIEDFTLSNSLKNDDTLKMYVGEDTIIIAQIRPLEGTFKYVNWSNTNSPAEDIIEIISSGRDTICRIKAKGVGVAKIAAETFDGQKDSCVVEVKGIKVDTMYMKVDTMYLDNKDHKDSILIATVGPINASDKSINWRSDNPLVVDVTSVEKDTVCHIETGYSGEAYIFAETPDSRFKDSCYVKVIVPVDSVVLRAEIFRNGSFESEPITTDGQKTLTMDLVADSIARLTAVVYPDSAKKFSYDTLIWTKLDPTLARIDSIPNDTTCYITALWSGYDTLYVKPVNYPDPEFKDWYFIKIDPREVDKVEIIVDDDIVTEDTIYLNVNDSFELSTTVYPWNATNDTLKLESTDTEIVKIDSTDNGVLVNGLKQGDAIIYARATDGTQQKDSFIVKVRNIPVTSLSLDRDTIRIYENNVDSVLATFTPVTATNKSVTWTSSKDDVVKIKTPTSTDTVCVFDALKADTALIRAVSVENGVAKDSCVVIVQEQFAFVDSVSSQGLISLSLKLPDDIMLTGSFELQLPKGFGLTLKSDGGYKTELEAPYKESSDLQIVALNDSTYTFNIALKASPTNGLLRAAAAKKKVMDIAYTIFNNDLENSTTVYDVKFVKVDFNLIDSDENVTKIKEDHTAKIKVFKDPTGNEFVESQELNAYIMDNRLYVNSVKAETVYVYSLNGTLLFSKDKAEGQAVFSLNTQEKVLIVRGSSGWVQKAANR